MNKSTLMWCCTVATVLAGCGGGGGGGAGETAAAPAQVEYVPAAASEGTATFAGWLKQMSAESMDGRDAMNTSTFKPTLQDDADPVAAPL
jgi:hypothetical protein